MIKHIVHINFSITVGGIDTMLVDILNEQCKIARTTLVIINDKIDDTVLKTLNPEVRVIKINRKEGAKDVLKIFKLNMILFKLNPSIIHCHNSNVVNFLVFKKCPIVLTVHDINYSTKSYHKYTHIFAISKAVKRDIEKNGNFPVSVIYNGVNEQLIRRKTEQNNKEEFKLVIVSRLEHVKKGQDLALKAIKNLSSNYKVRLDLIGNGNSLAYLKNLTLELGLNDKVNFLGVKSRNYIHENLKNYDLLIQPSRYEGFGLTIVEAMFAKIPVLASDIDGPSEILNKGEFGFCFKSNNLEDLILKLDAIIFNYTSFYNKSVNKAYLRAKEEFSISSTSKNYINYYKKILK
ncbi:glycosyltransferase [Polaribacter reichenbachii]|nr:glycosyltransferase family 4 protein [Polaribacter reichenbachii]APZ46549.1 glycosyltransferase [Polaribacter reichenbachii]AUC20385.1 glycosyltransferase [Polaribacter reichenbachii]